MNDPVSLYPSATSVPTAIFVSASVVSIWYCFFSVSCSTSWIKRHGYADILVHRIRTSRVNRIRSGSFTSQIHDVHCHCFIVETPNDAAKLGLIKTATSCTNGISVAGAAVGTTVDAVGGRASGAFARGGGRDADGAAAADGGI